MHISPLYENNDRQETIPNEGWDRQCFTKFSSTYLPQLHARRRFVPPKNTTKPKLDTTCLKALGSFKFGKLKIPYFEYNVPAGSPCRVDDPFMRHLDLSRYLIRDPKTSYYFKVSGYSMINAGINHKDLLVVDTAIKPKHRDIVIVVLNGEFKLKRLYLEDFKIKLLTANPDYPPITVTSEMDFFIQGVVTTVIRTFNPLPYDNHFKDLDYKYI